MENDVVDKAIQGKVVEITDSKIVVMEDRKQTYQKLKIKTTDGKEIIIENGLLPVANPIVYSLNDRVLLNFDGGKWIINDFIRIDGLVLLTIIFFILTIVVSGKRGIGALISMVASFMVIIFIMLPMLLKGGNPILITTLATIIIIPITFFMSHGLNKKTSIAIAGTVVAMLVTAVMSGIFINLTKLSGYTSEESGTLSMIKVGLIDMKGLLMGSIIIGLLGVLDDITVAQAGIVQQLKITAGKIKMWELYKRAMTVGQDHIASMVNTLILVYAGASLPLLLIFINNPHPFTEIVNYEFIAEEIVRTLCGSIGLILAVPVTTILAAMVFQNEKVDKR